MDAFPKPYIEHNVPFIVLSGLGSDTDHDVPEPTDFPLIAETGPRIRCNIDPVNTPLALQLLNFFRDVHAKKPSVRNRLPESQKGFPSVPFRLRFTGRDIRLPPKKAFSPPSLLGESDGSGSVASNSTPVLHSPISPLTPSSSTYADGLIAPIWIEKHQGLVPSAFTSFFTLTSDQDLIQQHDQHLKTQITAIKNALSAASSRTRYIVVLLSEKSVVQDPHVDERVSNIRRATGLDPKTSLFFVPPTASSIELQEFVHSFLATLQPACVEYYRDLSKHARRKRGRGSIPPPTASPTQGTSHILSTKGWIVRYEFKQGVFAEFRQEMEAACRHYETAYESLLDQDVFETISSWSPRWKEARLLSDTFAIRMIRCLLWNLHTTAAVRRWSIHRLKMRDLIDQRGLGTQGYGWSAWEARWANVMSELIQSNGVPGLVLDEEDPRDLSNLVIFQKPESSIPTGERLAPWELLHHEGYWYSLSASFSIQRRDRAKLIPEQDRSTPNQSPASKLASRPNLYDTYLCPDPHIESPLEGNEGIRHVDLITTELDKTRSAFSRRAQKRASEQYSLKMGKELMRAGQWEEALHILRHQWHSMSWRKEGWWVLVEDFLWTLLDAAARAGDGSCILGVTWELLSDTFAPNEIFNYDLMSCLDSFSNIKVRPNLDLQSDDVVCFFNSACTFRQKVAHVGEDLQLRLDVVSNAQKRSSPVTFSEIRIQFTGCLNELRLKHSSTKDTKLDKFETPETPTKLQLKPTTTHDLGKSALFEGEADLQLAAQSSKAFEFSVIPRDAGNISLARISFCVSTDAFGCEYTLESNQDPVAGPLKQDLGTRSHQVPFSPTIEVLAKPPKIQMHLKDTSTSFYTDERITIPFEIQNEEEEVVELSVEAKILGTLEELPTIKWRQDLEEEGISEISEGQSAHDPERLKIARLASAGVSEAAIVFEAPSFATQYTLDLKASYCLVSDKETLITKSVSVEIEVIAPFEPQYDFSPRLHKEPWPNFFAIEDVLSDPNEAHGIAQNWRLKAILQSFAETALVIDQVNLTVVVANGGINCVAKLDKVFAASSAIDPGAKLNRAFDIEVRKLSIEDKRSSSLDLNLEIEWHRDIGGQGPATNTTTLAVPHLLIPSGEPRVLATASRSESQPSLIHLDYVLENPSMHMLTFNLAMDASDEFAFSGPKLGVTQLLPLSREMVSFNIIPTGRGSRAAKVSEHAEQHQQRRRQSAEDDWIRANLKVVDQYYNRSLRVTAACDDVKMDQGGLLVRVGD